MRIATRAVAACCPLPLAPARCVFCCLLSFVSCLLSVRGCCCLLSVATVCCLQFSVCYLLSVVSCLLSIACRVLDAVVCLLYASVVWCLLSFVCCLLSTVCEVPSAVHSLLSVARCLLLPFVAAPTTDVQQRVSRARPWHSRLTGAAEGAVTLPVFGAGPYPPGVWRGARGAVPARGRLWHRNTG